MITVILGTAVIVTIVVMTGLWIDRKTPLLPRRAPAIERGPRADLPIPGETAATAVRVPLSWRARVAAGRCACGKPLAVRSDEPIRFAGRPLVVVRLACEACGHARSVYLDPSAAPA